jgi:hypothetical protein
MLNSLSHKGHANQNDSMIPSHHGQNGCHQENKQQQIVARMQGRRNSRTLLVEM